jgi:Flp pilus assembly protein TadG
MRHQAIGPGTHEQGQVLALFTIGFLAFVAMVAFVVDGGNVYAQERGTQNGTDAAALSGATVLAERLGGAAVTDADVLDAITTTATTMDVAVGEAVYTDIDGDPIGATVGAIGVGPPPAGAVGVAVTGERDFDTYFARAIGMNEFTAVTGATAITGYADYPAVGLLPVTPPVKVLTCDGQNRPSFQLPLQAWEADRIYRIPLCQSAPGNVGWLDWTPPAGGTSELAGCIDDPDSAGCDVVLQIPSWNFVAQTGNINANQVETALRTWDGDVVFVPLFDDTCNVDPVDPDASCPGGQGTGQNHWYHFPSVGVLELCTTGVTDIHGNTCTAHGSYITGNNRAECEAGGNGATSCLVGQFRDFVTSGEVVSPTPDGSSPSQFIAVQLIK